MKQLKKAVCILLIVILAVGFAGQSSVYTAEAKTSANGKLTISGVQKYEEAQQMLNVINQVRKKAGLSSVKMDKTLTDAAVTRAAELSIYIPQESPHKRPNGTSSRTADSRISYEICAESIGSGSYEPMSAEQVVNNWMGSSVHRKGILLPGAKSVGIACLRLESGVMDELLLWVVDCSESDAKRVEKSEETESFSRKIDVLPGYLQKSYFRFNTVKEMEVGERRDMLLEYKNKYALCYIRPVPSSFQWTSSKPSVASVTKKGVVKAKKAGTVKITAKLKTGTKVSISIKLKVKKPGI